MTWGWTDFSDISRSVLEGILRTQVGELSPGDHLIDDLGLDSFGLLVFVSEIEERLDVHIPPTTDEPFIGAIFDRVISLRRI